MDAISFPRLAARDRKRIPTMRSPRSPRRPGLIRWSRHAASCATIWAALCLGWGAPAPVSPAAAAEPQAPVRAGAATSNISPWLGLSINGNLRDVKVAHVHDELHARALVLDDGRGRLAL